MIALEEKLISGRNIMIRGLKKRFAHKFPNTELSHILLSEPDEMSIEALISKVGTWLAILDNESHNNLNNEINIKEVRK